MQPSLEGPPRLSLMVSEKPLVPQAVPASPEPSRIMPRAALRTRCGPPACPCQPSPELLGQEHGLPSEGPAPTALAGRPPATAGEGGGFHSGAPWWAALTVMTLRRGRGPGAEPRAVGPREEHLSQLLQLGCEAGVLEAGVLLAFVLAEWGQRDTAKETLEAVCPSAGNLELRDSVSTGPRGWWRLPEPTGHSGTFRLCFALPTLSCPRRLLLGAP